MRKRRQKRENTALPAARDHAHALACACARAHAYPPWARPRARLRAPSIQSLIIMYGRCGRVSGLYSLQRAQGPHSNVSPAGGRSNIHINEFRNTN